MHIFIQHADGRQQYLELDASRTLRFGTRSSVDVKFSGAEVESQHLGILLRDGAFVAVAYKRVGKICVNGSMVRKHTLQVGDLIQVGRNLIEVIADPSADQEVGPALETSPSSDTPQNELGEPLPSSSDEFAEPFESLSNDEDLFGDELRAGDLAQPSADGVVDLSALSDMPAEPAPALSATGKQSTAAAPRSAWWASSWFKAVVLLAVTVPLIVLVVLYLRQLPDARQRFLAADALYQQGDFARSADAFATYLQYHAGDDLASEAEQKRQLALLALDLERGVKAELLLARTARRWIGGVPIASLLTSNRDWLESCPL